MKNLAILGSTGSIGTQTLDIIKNKPELFSVFLLSADSNYNLLFECYLTLVNSLTGPDEGLLQTRNI